MPEAAWQATLQVMGSVVHGWSIDVEDWFHILDASGAPDPSSWAQLPSRVAIGTRRMLDLLDRHRVRATFFTLGWIAERHPELIAEIAARGHEVGSHGHLHRLVHQGSRDDFARDLDASLHAISRAIGRPVKAFRAPGFSIGDGETWALPVLASRGITLDASLFLAHHGHGGIVLRRERPDEPLCLAGGVALNCTLNGAIVRSGWFSEVWVAPSPGDPGNALGAALLWSARHQQWQPGPKSASLRGSTLLLSMPALMSA